jgi:hypothetical protein
MPTKAFGHEMEGVELKKGTSNKKIGGYVE